MAVFLGRCLFSLACLGFSLAVTIEALFLGKTALWEGVPNIIGLILFFGLMCCVGLLEGMQIAFFAVSKLPKSERGTSKIALQTCDILFRNGGKNLPGFMCGRQMTVTLCFFVIARVTTLNIAEGDETIFGVSPGVQNFFNLGFLGALITTILGSISWQLVAGAFPIGFLGNPVVLIFLKLALWLEATGICAAAWFLAMIQKKITGFQFDEVYVGTPEERAARKHADNPEAQEKMIHMGTYGLTGAVGESVAAGYKDLAAPTWANLKARANENVAALKEQIEQAETEEEKKAFEDALALEMKTLGALSGGKASQSGGGIDIPVPGFE